VPFSTEFLEGGVIQVGTGVVFGAEILEAAVELYRLEDRARDHLRVDRLHGRHPVSGHGRAGAPHRGGEPLFGQTPRAVVAVVAPGDTVFGMARMWQAFANKTGWEIEIVWSKPAATVWLRSRLGRDV
jgi:hypothetical protein